MAFDNQPRSSRLHHWMSIIIAIALGSFPELAGAAEQSIEISSSFNPVGSGARATGMGGAFIAIADDATAASWNPAGLVQLEKPEVSIVYATFNREQTYTSSEHPEIDGSHRMGADGLNFASVAYPLVLLNHNMTVSLNYQRLYEMNKEVNFLYTTNSDVEEISFERKGFLYAISPALAIRLTPRFAVGSTVNFWGPYAGSNGWDSLQQWAMRASSPPWQISSESRTTFAGKNVHVGVLWNISGALALGGVYKSEFKAKLEQVTMRSYFEIYPDETIIKHIRDEDEQRLAMPPSYGLGLSYRHSDTWSVGLDVYHTQWSHFTLRTKNGDELNPITNQYIADGRLGDTTQVRLGAEYLVIRPKYVVPVRFGLFYDPEPVSEGSVGHYGVTCGSGFQRGPLAFDLAYQYRQGSSDNSDISAIENRIDVRYQSMMMSLIYYF